MNQLSFAFSDAITTTKSLTTGKVGGSTGLINFNGNASGTVTLSVLDAAGTWTMKLPATHGTANQYLQTDGSGNTTWATVVPGTGTVTSVGSGAGLTGGPITGSGSLALDLTRANTWTGKHIFAAPAGTVKALFQGATNETADFWDCNDVSGNNVIWTNIVSSTDGRFGGIVGTTTTNSGSSNATISGIPPPSNAGTRPTATFGGTLHLTDNGAADFYLLEDPSNAGALFYCTGGSRGECGMLLGVNGSPAAHASAITPANHAGPVDNVTYLGDASYRWAGLYSCEVSVINATAADIPLKVAGATSQSGVMVQLQGTSSTTAGRPQADIDTAWHDSTDATRSADLIFRAWYITTAKEGMRIRGLTGGVAIGFFGATPALQQTALGTTTGFTAHATANAVFNESTWTGGSGSSAYTNSDIVLALKNLGVLAL